MYSLTHFFAVVGREMTAGGSAQIFSLCWASFPGVHTPASTPLFLGLRSFLPPSCSVIFSKEGFDDLICACVSLSFTGSLHLSLSLSLTHTHTHTHAHTSAVSESCCVIVSSECGGNTGIRLSASRFVTSQRRIQPLPTHTHTYTHTHTHTILFPCIPGYRCLVSLCRTLLEGPFPLPRSHLLTSCPLTSRLP